MNNIPKPIDVNKLKGLLGGAKAIMDKVESGNYESGNIDGRALNSDGVKELQVEGVRRPQQSVAPQMQQRQGGEPYYRNMANSKMPDAIKKAMMNTPIVQSNGLTPQTFSLEDVQPQEHQRPPQYPKTPNTNTRQPMYEQHQPMSQNNDGTFTVSESALKAIVKDTLLEFMATTFTQNLSEEVIKKTITTLVKEGKINVKKKVK